MRAPVADHDRTFVWLKGMRGSEPQLWRVPFAGCAEKCPIFRVDLPASDARTFDELIAAFPAPIDNEGTPRMNAKASQSVEDRIREIVVTNLGAKPDNITRDAHLIDDIGADSLELIELTMAVEDEFGIEIPDDQLDHMLTFGAVVEFVERQFAAKAGTAA
jgi:acyl carrier protein